MAGEQGYALEEVDWPTDPRIFTASLLVKWTHHCLWNRARKERRNVLPPYYSPAAIAQIVGSDSTADSIACALEELEATWKLIAKCPCGCGAIWVKGVSSHHTKVTNWKDRPPLVQDDSGQFREVQANSEPRCWCSLGVGGVGVGLCVADATHGRVDYAKVLSWWNGFAPGLGLSKVTSLSDKRKVLVRRKMLTDAAFADLDELAKAIGDQDFLHGNGNRGWKLTFDALFERKDMALKILERQYGNSGKKSDFREKAKKILEEAEKGFNP